MYINNYHNYQIIYGKYGSFYLLLYIIMSVLVSGIKCFTISRKYIVQIFNK